MVNPFKICKTCRYARVLPGYCICRRYGSTTMAVKFTDFCGFWRFRMLDDDAV